jgi:hypothetical protein
MVVMKKVLEIWNFLGCGLEENLRERERVR